MTVGPDGLPYGPEGGFVAQMRTEEEEDHVDMLRDTLLHRDPVRRQKAAIAMASYIGDQMHLPVPLEPHPAQVLAEAMLKKRAPMPLLVEGCQAFAIMGPHCAVRPLATECLGKMVKVQEPTVQFEAVRAIGLVGPAAADHTASALADIVVDLEDATALLRFQAARTLEALGPAAAPAAAVALGRALSDKDPDVRAAATKALAAMGAPAAAAAPALVAVLGQKKSFELKRLAVDALASMGEPAATAAGRMLGRILRPTIGDDAMLRLKAAEALGTMGDAEVRKYERQLQLAKALGDPDPLVAKAARETLRAAGCKRALNGAMALFEKVPEPAKRPAPEAPAAEAPAAEAPAAEAPAAEAPAAEAPAADRPPTAAAAQESADPPPAEADAPGPAADAADAADTAPAAAAPGEPPAEEREKQPTAFSDFIEQAERRASVAKQDEVRLESQKVMANLGIEPDATPAKL